MSEWVRSALGTLVEFRKGTKVDVFDSDEHGRLPYLGASMVDGGEASQFAPAQGGVVAETCDLLMLWDGERSGLLGGRMHGVVASTVARLRPSGNIDPNFLRHALQHKFGWIQARRTGTGVPHVPKDLSTWLAVDHPVDVAEQKRLADVLDCVDAKIRVTEDLIRKLDLVGQGLLSSLLHVDETCPYEWTLAPLDDVTAVPITYGIVQAGPHVPGGIPYVRTGDMSGDDLVVDQMLRTSPRIAASYGRSTLRTGDLVCAIRATVGKVLPVPPELNGGNLTQGTARVAPGRAVDPRFLFWEMKGGRVQRQIALAVKGTTFLEITLAALRRVQVAYPRLEEQKAIAATLDSHDDMVRREKEFRDALRELKAGLATDLLGGRIAAGPRGSR